MAAHREQAEMEGRGTLCMRWCKKPRGLLFPAAAVLSLYGYFLGSQQLIPTQPDSNVHPSADPCAASHI